MAEQAQRAAHAGYGTVKLKVGKDVASDVAAVTAVRHAVGEEVAIYVDANNGYSRRDALGAARGFEQQGVMLFEEPVAARDTDGRARLARATDILILLDESTNDLADVPREIAAGTAGAISVRAARTGVSLTRHLVGLAMANHVPLLVGSHRELGVGVATNAHLAAGFRAMAFPAELGSHVFLEDGLLREPLRIEGGRLHLPDGPGLGVELDPDRAAHYRLWTATVGDVPS
jgi:L-alanine-DL-glutamate epimerase-like enolase superfamily enzyme